MRVPLRSAASADKTCARSGQGRSVFRSITELFAMAAARRGSVIQNIITTPANRQHGNASRFDTEWPLHASRQTGNEMSKQKTWTAAIATTLLISACGNGDAGNGSSASGGSGEPADRDSACEAAASGGPLDWWTQDPETAETIIEMFNQEYPDIEVNFTQLLENDIAQRIVAESNAKQLTADLVVGHMAAFQPLIERQLVDTELQWPTEIDDNLRSDTNMIRISRRVNGIVYNTDRYSADDLPDTWEDLVDPEWAGTTSVHTTGIPFDVLSIAWGEDETLDWARRLEETVQPAVINGTTAGIQAAASGEVPIALSGRDSEANEQKAAGAPVDIKYLDPVPTFDFYEMIPAGAEDVDAAVCFATWYVTDAKDDVLALSHASNDDIPPGLPAGAELITVAPDDVAQLGRMAPEISDIWVNGS
jgi:iron(III) transport system substrate-binding protein